MEYKELKNIWKNFLEVVKGIFKCVCMIPCPYKKILVEALELFNSVLYLIIVMITLGQFEV